MEVEFAVALVVPLFFVVEFVYVVFVCVAFEVAFDEGGTGVGVEGGTGAV